MSKVKLRRCNRKKYCPRCKDTVEVVMVDETGFCPNCEGKIYTIDTRGK